MTAHSKELQDKSIREYLATCEKLIELKERGEYTEEEVGGELLGTGLDMFSASSIDSVIESILDAASDLQIPREISYKQEIGAWDAKIADTLKREEWEELLNAVTYAKKSFNL